MVRRRWRDPRETGGWGQHSGAESIPIADRGEMEEEGGMVADSGQDAEAQSPGTFPDSWSQGN